MDTPVIALLTTPDPFLRWLGVLCVLAALCLALPAAG